jgi:hypothetical protein
MTVRKAQKTKKEEGMKKLIVLMLALCLAVPAISHAGTATSRWDLMIGGTIKMDMGWVDSKGTGDLSTSGVVARDDREGFRTPNNKYGNQIWGSAESGFNFFVRGPDAWGAKTSAFMSFDATGVWGGSNYGSVDVLLANMSFDWEKTTLLIGDAGSAFGMLPTFAGNQSAWGAIGLFGDKGAAPILTQITWTQRWTKEWTTKFGIMANANNMRNFNNFPVAASNADVAATRATTPGVQGGVTYSSAACGRVGPWQLTLGTSAGLIRQKQVTTFNNVLGRADTADDDTTGWLADFKVLVPIIPQKNDGNKQNALYWDGVIWMGQNFDGFNAGFGGTGTSAYNRGTVIDPDYASLVNSGFYTHAAYYILDNLWFNGFYMYAGHDMSQNYKRNINTGVAKNASQIIASLCYDVNPAVRFSVQWDRTHITYAQAQPGLKQEGTQNAYRFAAYYYF